jgi:hypothetical protein
MNFDPQTFVHLPDGPIATPLPVTPFLANARNAY